MRKLTSKTNTRIDAEMMSTMTKDSTENSNVSSPLGRLKPSVNKKPGQSNWRDIQDESSNGSYTHVEDALAPLHSWPSLEVFEACNDRLHNSATRELNLRLNKVLESDELVTIDGRERSLLSLKGIVEVVPNGHLNELHPDPAEFPQHQS